MEEEYLRVEYATIIQRFVALLIDSVILAIVAYIFGFAIYMGVYGYAGIIFIIELAYFVFLEGPGGQGQTIGKKLMSLRVVNADTGEIIGYDQSFIRNILRIIDWLPFFYIVGIVLISSSDMNQRLGDRAANSIVIYEV